MSEKTEREIMKGGEIARHENGENQDKTSGQKWIDKVVERCRRVAIVYVS